MRTNKLCELCAQCIPVFVFVLLLHSCHAHILNRTLRANYFILNYQQYGEKKKNLM